MLLFKRLSSVCAFALILLCVTACGFTPLYKTQSGGTIVASTQNIKISNIPNRNGQFLRNLLIDTLYGTNPPATTPRYRLDITKLNIQKTSLGVRKDATATRAQLRVTANLTLIDTHADAADNIVLQRSLRTVNSFNILDSQYATRISQQNATELSLQTLSEQTVTALALYFKTTRGTQ